MSCRPLSVIAIVGAGALAACTTPAPKLPSEQTGSATTPAADQPAPPALRDHDPKLSDCRR